MKNRMKWMVKLPSKITLVSGKIKTEGGGGHSCKAWSTSLNLMENGKYKVAVQPVQISVLLHGLKLNNISTCMMVRTIITVSYKRVTRTL